MPKGKFGLDKVLMNIEQVKRDLPILLSKQAERYFTASFSNQSFNHKAWEEVKRRIEGTNEYKYPKRRGLSRRTKPILVGTGALRRATSNSTRSLYPKNIRLVIDLPYAAVHNEGSGNIPKRQYVGQTKELTRKQKTLIERHIDKVWQA